MIIKTNKLTKDNEPIYRNKLTDEEGILPRVSHHKTKKTIPDYAFAEMGIYNYYDTTLKKQ